MQRSQQGLPQQLLFEILRCCLDLIPTVCPFSNNPGYRCDWSLEELKSTFRRLSHETLQSTTFCFFVDGLDEYSGDHLDLIKVIKDLADMENIKLCVSSRPWNCFENAFGQEPDQKLCLQDLTKDDMAIFARDKMAETSELPLITQMRTVEFEK